VRQINQAIVLVLAWLACLVLAGCEHVQSVGVTGTYNPQTEAFGGGLTIVFREPPSAEVLEKLRAAGAIERAPTTFRLPPVPDTRSASAQRARRVAVRAAMESGATIQLAERGEPTADARTRQGGEPL
jgi:hypothetical protein